MRVALHLRELACCVLLLGVFGCGRLGYEVAPGRMGGPRADAGLPVDMTNPGDTGASAETSLPTDAGPADLDLALPPDVALPADLALPADMTSPADRDMAPPRDAAPPPDTSPPAGDFTLGGQTETTREGRTDLGTPYQDICPAGQAIIGYRGFQANSPTMPWLRSMQTQCGALLLGPAPGYAVTTTPGASLPDRGHAAGTSWTRLCPANQVVVGFAGRSSSYLDAIAPRCAPLTVSGSPGNFRVSLGAITSTQQTDSNAGDPFSPIDCPAGKVAVGSNLTADNYPRSFGLYCATPSPR